MHCFHSQYVTGFKLYILRDDRKYHLFFADLAFSDRWQFIEARGGDHKREGFGDI